MVMVVAIMMVAFVMVFVLAHGADPLASINEVAGESARMTCAQHGGPHGQWQVRGGRQSHQVTLSFFIAQGLNEWWS